MSPEQQHPGSGPVLAGGAGDDLELYREQWAAVCPREITPEQWRRFEGYMLEIFTAMGMPAGTVSTAATPRRFLRAIRLVRLFARRFTVQERIGQQLADALERILKPHGVAVHLEAVHLCTQMRGVREIESSTRTTYWRGNYDEDPDLRAGFFGLCGRPG
jgi:GTP cyclohydrolase I